MDLQKKIASVLYIDKTSLMYIDTVSGITFTYTYPPDVISDLEIIHEDMLEQQLVSLIEMNTITQASAVMLLSQSILFEKKVPLGISSSEENDTIQKFVEMVPFESVGFTKYPVADGVVILAANTVFFTTIKQICEKKGINISYVFPAEIFGESLDMGLTNEVLVRIIGKIDSKKQYNLLSRHDSLPITIEKVPTIVEKKSTKRLYFLGGVFAFLLTMLAIMIFIQR